MAEEFLLHNGQEPAATFQAMLPPIVLEPHVEFKRRVPGAIGLIRTAGIAQYSNVIVGST